MVGSECGVSNLNVSRGGRKEHCSTNRRIAPNFIGMPYIYDSVRYIGLELDCEVSDENEHLLSVGEQPPAGVK